MTRRVEDSDQTLTLHTYQRLQAQARFERDLRLAEKDLRYRMALGLTAGEELPKALGSAGGRRMGAAQRSIRATKRPA